MVTLLTPTSWWSF